MNKVQRYLWLALVVAVVVTAVVVKKDALRDIPRLMWDSFLKRPLISQIIIGFVVWLISLIVGLSIFWKLFYPGEGPGFGVLLMFLVFWPPAWPIAVIVLPVLLIRKGFEKK